MPSKQNIWKVSYNRSNTNWDKLSCLSSYIFLSFWGNERRQKPNIPHLRAWIVFAENKISFWEQRICQGCYLYLAFCGILFSISFAVQPLDHESMVMHTLPFTWFCSSLLMNQVSKKSKDLSTLESGIDIGQGITVGSGKLVKKNKRRAWNKRRVWTKCTKLCYKKASNLKKSVSHGKNSKIW